MKRTALLILIGIMVFTLLACSGPENKTVQIKPRIVMISDTAGLGDQGLNDIVWAGCEKASKKKDVDIRCLESGSREEYIKNMETAVQEDAVVIVCAGSDLTDATKATATAYPKTKFILVGGQLNMDNVTCLSFQEQEAGFLAGIAAARTSTTKKIGFIGGIKNPEMEKYQFGFVAGIKTAEPQVEVVVDYTGNVDREQDGIDLAKKQREEGVDVIFQNAGRGGLGLIDLAGEDDFWVIGSERDQSGLNSKHVLCSVAKDGEAAVHKEIDKALKGNLKGGTISYDLKNGGISLSDNAGNLDAETKKEIDKWKDVIIKGDIIVPLDEKSLAKYVPPEI